jgi:phosphatidylglycerophosphate synthase
MLLYIADDPRLTVSPMAPVAGLPIAERVVRAALRAGFDRVLIFGRTPELARLRRLDPRITLIDSHEAWRRQLATVPSDAPVTAVGPGTIVSSTLMKAAIALPSNGTGPVDVAAGPRHPVSGLVRLRAGQSRDLPQLTDLLLNRALRGDRQPSGEDVSHGRAHLAIRVDTADRLPDADTTMRRATFKETDATLARFNRRVSLPISIALLRTPVTANMMSLFVLGLGLLSAWLFSRGEYLAGVAGGLLSLAASILDGCDGEIARLKYQESALGCWLETIGDYSYYLAIFVGLTIGAVRQTGMNLFYPVGAVGLAGTVLSFMLLIYLRRRITEGRPETLHAVARARFRSDPSWWSVIVWRISFVATRAAMPYGIAVLAFLWLLPLVVVLSAVGANVYWISLALKLRHLLGAGELGSERPTGRLAPQS